MRIVVDTNVVVSGLLWRGPPRRLLEAARDGAIELFTSGALMAELEDALQRPKFLKQLTQAQVQPEELVKGYAALAQPPAIEPVILHDPDDDAVLACAVGAAATKIISGD